MKSFLFVFTAALIFTVALIPWTIRLSVRLGAMSDIGGRNVGVTRVGRLGGIGILIGTMGAILLLLATNSSIAQQLLAHARLFVGLAVGGVFMAALGFADDVRRVRAIIKLAVQIVAALFAYAAGFRIDAVSLPLVGDLHFGIFAPLVTTIWIVGVVNAINLIDGLDGLAGGIAFIASVTNFMVGFVAASNLVCLFMAAIGGAVLGFLVFNWHPAKIYMGDAGSYFLGFVLATSSLLGSAQKASTTISILVPVLAMGVPIFDTLFAMVRRFLERRPVFSPDRGHVHHRLLDLGLTQRRVVLGLYGVSVLLTGISVMIAFERDRTVGAVISASGILGLVAWGWSANRARREASSRESTTTLTSPEPDTTPR